MIEIQGLCIPKWDAEDRVIKVFGNSKMRSYYYDDKTKVITVIGDGTSMDMSIEELESNFNMLLWAHPTKEDL